jgi:uncharacterized membrane protein (DUF4010 family)
MIFVMVLSALAPALMLSLLIPIGAIGLTLLLMATLFIRGGVSAHPFELPANEGAFQISHALLIAAAISAVSLCSAWLRTLFGDSGALATTIVVGLVELHAAAVGIAQLSPAHTEPSTLARWGVIGVLGASVCSKLLLAYFSGGKVYGTKITMGLVLCMTSAVTAMLVIG